MGLLFDQVMFDAYKKGARLYGLHRGIKGGIPVYDATSIRWLLDEVAGKCKNGRSPIPFRPPHDCMWIEWTLNEAFHDGPFAGTGKTANVTTAAFWAKAPDSDPLTNQIRASLSTLHEKFPEIGTPVSFPHIYQVFTFERWNSGAIPHASIRGIPIMYTPISAVGFSEDWTVSANDLLDGDTQQVKTFTPTPVIPHPHPERLGADSGFMSIWTFSLLHCRNIHGVKLPPNDPHKQAKLKEGWPQKTSYHILRLELPASIRPRDAVEESNEEKRKMRFHLCRGHFKNLQHDRFKVKGWHWWPAHWRGDEDVGTVDKIYQPRPANE